MDGLISDSDTTMVAASIGILACIFICALIGLVAVCKRLRKRQQKWDRFENKYGLKSNSNGTNCENILIKFLAVHRH